MVGLTKNSNIINGETPFPNPNQLKPIPSGDTLQKRISQQKIVSAQKPMNSKWTKCQGDSSLSDKAVGVFEEHIGLQGIEELKKEIDACFQVHNAAPSMPKLQASLTKAVIAAYFRGLPTIALNRVFDFAVSAVAQGNKAYKANMQLDRKKILMSVFEQVAQDLQQPVLVGWSRNDWKVALLDSLTSDEKILLSETLAANCVKLCKKTSQNPSVNRENIEGLARTIKQARKLLSDTKAFDNALISFMKGLSADAIKAFSAYHAIIAEGGTAENEKKKLYHLIQLIPMLSDATLEKPEKVVDELEIQLFNKITSFSNDLLKKIEVSQLYEKKARAAVCYIIHIKDFLEKKHSIQFLLEIYYMFEDFKKISDKHPSIADENDLILKSLKKVLKGLFVRFMDKVDGYVGKVPINLSTLGDIAAVAGLNEDLPKLSEKLGFPIKLEIEMKTKHDALITRLTTLCPQLHPDEIVSWVNQREDDELVAFNKWLESQDYLLFARPNIEPLYRQFKRGYGR